MDRVLINKGGVTDLSKILARSALIVLLLAALLMSGCAP